MFLTAFFYFRDFFSPSSIIAFDAPRPASSAREGLVLIFSIIDSTFLSLGISKTYIGWLAGLILETDAFVTGIGSGTGDVTTVFLGTVGG